MNRKTQSRNITSIFLVSLLLDRSSDKGEDYYESLFRNTGMKKLISSGTVNDRVEELAKCGWVICPYWECDLDKNESVVDTWYQMLQTKRQARIVNYFKKENYELLKRIYSHMRFEFTDRQYEMLEEAYEVFCDKRYFSCMYILSALIEGSIRKMPNSKWKYRLTECFKENFVKEINDIDETHSTYGINVFFTKNFLTVSLEQFVLSYYLLPNENRLETNNEPKHMTRNWLMHGMTKRRVSETDCIKLFNALSTLIYIKRTLNNQL